MTTVELSVMCMMKDVVCKQEEYKWHCKVSMERAWLLQHGF